MTRITVLKVGFSIFALAIVGRAVQLQLLGDERLEKLATRQFSSKLTTLPRRGNIFDRNGEGLAISLKVHSIFFRPELLRKDLKTRERNRLLYNLAQILKMPVEQLSSKARSDKGFVWIKRQLTPSEEQAIKDRGILDYGDGVGLAEETKRHYPNKELGAHVLGAVGVDGQGLEGLELLYEGILTGERVRISSNKDAMGRKIFRDDKGLLAFKDGASLVLTIDKAIQYEAEKALHNAVTDYQAKAGTIIVAEVESGEILAMANYPTYNPNSPRGASADSRRNRAITDSYEPGSTFKPLLMGYALDRGKSPKTKIYCEKGSFKVGDRTITEAETHEKYEWLTYGEIIKHSSNIGVAKLALELGPSNVSQLADRIGLGKRTEIDLPGEAGGSFSKKELFSPVRLANVAFGQGLTVTPLQMLTYYLAIANGGLWVQPKIVKAILNEDPESLERGAIRWKLGHRFDTVKTRRVFNPQTTQQLTSMLEGVVEEDGTATKAQLDEWPVAGKTGTAQKVDPETHRYSRSKYMSSFIGFAPAKRPTLAALVLLDEPTKKYYAGEVAAPTFREVMRASLLRERVAPIDGAARTQQLANQSSLDLISAETLSAPQKYSKRDGAAELPTSPEQNAQAQIRLPSLAGLSVRETMRMIGGQPLDIEVVGSGILREQSPAPGVWLEPGSKVRLVFAE